MKCEARLVNFSHGRPSDSAAIPESGHSLCTVAPGRCLQPAVLSTIGPPAPFSTVLRKASKTNHVTDHSHSTQPWRTKTTRSRIVG